MKVYPVYKKVKMLMPHCSHCKEMLRGNGSIISPYECKCGVWEYDYLNNGTQGNSYNIKSKKVDNSII